MKGETAWFAKAAPGIPVNLNFLWHSITFMLTFGEDRAKNGNRLHNKL